MERQNQNLPTIVQKSIVISEKETYIAKELYHINQLVSYPLSESQIEDWAKSINELSPSTTPQDLKIIINKMKMGEVEYNHIKGIQNIFIALKNLDKNPKTIAEIYKEFNA